MRQGGEVTDEEFFEELLRVALRLQKLPGRSAFNLLASPAASLYAQERYGDWDQVLDGFREWLTMHHPDSPLLEQTKSPEPRRRVPHDSSEGSGQAGFGGPLRIRGMRYAPINETGVIFLFGVLAQDLGYVIEAIRPAFPDCEAKRLVDARNDIWQRVMIEFEFRASSFRDHAASGKHCDLVVCWENDWPECPVDVLELKSLVVA